jgi:hypothetical protein
LQDEALAASAVTCSATAAAFAAAIFEDSFHFVFVVLS